MGFLFYMIRKILVLALVVLFVFACYRTWKSWRSPNQQIFADGDKPEPLPNGFYRGSATGYEGSWRGKSFNAARSTGINVFGDAALREEKYPFQTSYAPGAWDTKTTVLRIDYNVEGNPFWLWPVLDEIVQTGPNQYLGKVYIRIIPWFPFMMGYFRLEK